MTNNSFLFIDKELDEFALDEQCLTNDYMMCADISWVSQVKPFIEQFSKEGDLVFDPFAGLGTTLLGAGYTGRRSIGLEIDEGRFQLLGKRIKKHSSILRYQPEITLGDALVVDYPKDVDLVMTNFPYFHSSFNLNNTNLYALADYDTYLQSIEHVILKCKSVLKKGGYMVVFTENIRLSNGNVIPQAFDIAKLIQKHLNLKEERIILYSKAANILEDPTYTNRAHEYVFVARQRTEQYDDDIFRSILKDLSREIKYVVVGSYGLSLLPEGKALDCYPEDVDLFVSSIDEAIKIAYNLRLDGYTIYSWDTILNNAIDKSELAGRYYLRASKKIDGRVYKIDINYESDVVSYDQMYSSSSVINGIRVANLEYIVSLLRNRNSDRDKALIYRIEQFKN